MSEQKQRPLTDEEKIKIYKAIAENILPDDRYPYQVIDDTFGGDEDAYLRVMARWHNVPLEH